MTTGTPPHRNAFPAHLIAYALRWWRENRQMSLRQVAPDVPIDHSHLAKMERGQRPAPRHVIDQLDRIYTANGQLTALHTAITRLDHESMPDLAFHAQGKDEDMERRALLQLFAALSTGAVVPAGTVETILSRAESALGQHENTELAHWEELVFEYGCQYVTRPPGSLISAAANDLVEVSRLLGTSQTSFTRAGLLRISSQLSAILAMEFSDIGERNAALRSWRLARRTADETNDRDLRVWVRARESTYAFWAGRPAPTVSRLADEAIEISGGAPSTSLARAYSAKAIAAASEGDAAQARSAQHDLDRTYEALPDPDRGSPLWSFSERRMHWSQAYPSALMGDTAEASQALERALALCPVTLRADVTELKLMQALALVHDRDITTSLDIASTAAEEQPLGASRRRIMGQIIQALPESARTVPATRELRALTV
ncbi:helix-turn-helix domain-containing protein [Acrocarpospora catenulata]|uniref:helix-turn-helix domain-containing protein n=1 Tax=Acrocarpospora catenulata TaxID=2836182 RepID=UPI001BDB3CF9|nr:helix-turn-helix transcriptional regulator [Acrocarpospora catenulata]